MRDTAGRNAPQAADIFAKLLSLGTGQNWLGLEQNVVRAEGLEPSWAV